MTRWAQSHGSLNVEEGGSKASVRVMQRETRPVTAGLEDGRGFRPWNSGSLRKLEKARKWTHPRAPKKKKKKSSPNNILF